MKSDEEAMEILEAYDLTKGYRGAAELCGCDHHTVAYWVGRRDAGEIGEEGRIVRERIVDGYPAEVGEWVEVAKAKVRGDVVHKSCSPSATPDRSAPPAGRWQRSARWRSGHRRHYRPWIPEPGMWFQATGRRHTAMSPSMRTRRWRFPALRTSSAMARWNWTLYQWPERICVECNSWSQTAH